MSAPFAAKQLGNPTLSGVPLRISPNLAMKALTTVCPEHRERKTPDVGGLQCVSRRFGMKFSQTPNETCWPAGWRLRVTRATSSTGVKGGLQNEAGNGATPNITCPAEAWSRCCDNLGKRMVTAMRPASGWPSVSTPYSRDSLRRKLRTLVKCRVPLLMLDTEQRLRKLTSMR